MLTFSKFDQLNTISFRTSLSTTTCTSTCESELGAANFTARAVESMRNVALEVFKDYSRYLITSSTLAGDNTAANLIGSNTTGTRAVRHLSLQHFFVRGLSVKGLLSFRLVPSAQNPSDMLTKVLPEEVLRRLLDMICCKLM